MSIVQWLTDILQKIKLWTIVQPWEGACGGLLRRAHTPAPSGELETRLRLHELQRRDKVGR